MAQDRNGRTIKPGDVVNIRCIVKGVDAHEDHINLAVESVEGRVPDGLREQFIINSHMVEVIVPLGQSDPSLDVAKAISDSGTFPSFKG